MEDSSLNFDWVSLPNITDSRGVLTYIEEYDVVPFPISHISYCLGNESFQTNLSIYLKTEQIALVGIEGTAILDEKTMQFSSSQSKILFTKGELLNNISFSHDFIGLILTSSSSKQKGQLNDNNQFGEIVTIDNSLFPPDQIPIKIPRVFFISNVVNGSRRGEHAHKTCDQILLMLKGTCEICLEKDGIKKEFKLYDTKQLVHLPSKTWLELRNFEKGSILLVLSSEEFIEENYIRDYKVYKDSYPTI